MSTPTDGGQSLALGDHVRLKSEDGCMVVKGIHGSLAYCVPADPGALWPSGTFAFEELQRVEAPPPVADARWHDV